MLEGAAILDRGADHPAQPVGSLDQHHLQAALARMVGGGESSDAGAYDDDGHRALRSWT